MEPAQKLAAARKRKGWSQEVLAERLGVSRQAIAKWESGQTRPSTANLMAAAKELGLPLTDDDFSAPSPAAPAIETPPAAPAAPPRRSALPWLLLLFLLYTALLTAVLFFGGVMPMALCLVVLLLCTGVFALFFGFRTVYAPGSIPGGVRAICRQAVLSAAFILLGGALCLGIWRVRQAAAAQYRAAAHWAISRQKIADVADLSRFISTAENMGDGIYVVSQSVPSAEGTCVRYLVYRHNVGGDAPGQITPDPLRHRFTVTYPDASKGNAAADTFDLLELSGKAEFFNLDFAVEGQGKVNAVFAGDPDAYNEFVNALWWSTAPAA